ncbi:MAG: hypothetical protein ACK559_40040, partial [bacterium]
RGGDRDRGGGHLASAGGGGVEADVGGLAAGHDPQPPHRVDVGIEGIDERVPRLASQVDPVERALGGIGRFVVLVGVEGGVDRLGGDRDVGLPGPGGGVGLRVPRAVEPEA